MGCRTLTAPEEIAEAEYVGTMLHRYDKRAFASMEKLNRYMPILESECCREESARRIWDRFSPPDYNFNCKRLSTGAKRNGYNCFDMTQEEMAVSNGNTDDGYAYFYGNRVSGRLDVTIPGVQCSVGLTAISTDAIRTQRIVVRQEGWMRCGSLKETFGHTSVSIPVCRW